MFNRLWSAPSRRPFSALFSLFLLPSSLFLLLPASAQLEHPIRIGIGTNTVAATNLASRILFHPDDLASSTLTNIGNRFYFIPRFAASAGGITAAQATNVATAVVVSNNAFYVTLTVFGDSTNAVKQWVTDQGYRTTDSNAVIVAGSGIGVSVATNGAVFTYTVSATGTSGMSTNDWWALLASAYGGGTNTELLVGQLAGSGVLTNGASPSRPLNFVSGIKFSDTPLSDSGGTLYWGTVGAANSEVLTLGRLDTLGVPRLDGPEVITSNAFRIINNATITGDLSVTGTVTALSFSGTASNASAVGGTALSGLLTNGGHTLNGQSITNGGAYTVAGGASAVTQWVDVVKLGDWATPFAGPTANSNAVAPVWVFSANVTNDLIAFGDSSPITNALQDTYRAAMFGMPFGATAWGGETAMVFRVWASTNDATLSACDVKLVSPDGVVATTNGLTGGNGDWTDYHFTTNWLPAFAQSNATNSWRIRLTRYVRNGHTNACGVVRFNVR
jgi:hypothetical protein